MFANNLFAFVAAFALALTWLRVNDFFAHQGWISSFLSRKIIHIGTGPIFVLSWLLFNDSFSSRFLAALIPLVITVQFALVGFGVLRDPAAVKAMSRSGERREILRGPLLYGIVFVVLTIVYWNESPIGIVALMLLCGGDGLAEVAGKLLKTSSLPWSPRKSWGGLGAMFVGGWLLSFLVLAVYLRAGVFGGTITEYLPGLTLIGLAATLVESLPMENIDNLSIPLVSIILGHFLLV